MSLPNPLLRRIRTQEHIYIYCAKTHRIFLVTEAMSDILEYYGRQSKEETFDQLKQRHSASELEEGWYVIDRLNQQYRLFATTSLETRINCITEEQVAEELSQGIPTLCLEVTEACNLRCHYCVYSGGYPHTRTHGTRHMDWPAAKAAIDLLNARHHGIKDGRPNVGFYGGEPLLRFDFIKRCVEYAESLAWDGPSGVSFNMTTNGTLLTDGIIDFILAHNVTPTISLDGPQSEHDRHRVFPDGRGSFAHVFENIKKLGAHTTKKEHHSSALINCVISPGSDLMALNQFFTENAAAGLISGMIVAFVSPGHHTFFEQCPKNPDQPQQLEALRNAYHQAHLQNFVSHAPENIFIGQLFEKDYIDLRKRSMGTTAEDRINMTRMCFPGKQRPFVSVDGRIHACERINNTLSLGDVWHGFDIPRITRLWNQFAELSDQEDCRTCWAVRLCPFCFNIAADNGGFSAALKRAECKSIKNQWARALQDFCQLQELNAHAFDYMGDYLVR